jgi:hypothetical protein
MADNKTTVDASGATFTMAFKDADNVFHPRSLTQFDVAGVPTDVGSANPLPVGVSTVPQRGATFLVYDWANGLRQAFTSTTARSAIPAGATALTLVANQRCFVRLGNSSVNATVGAGSIPIPAELPFTVGVGSATHIAYIRDTVDGNLTIMGATA